MGLDHPEFPYYSVPQNHLRNFKNKIPNPGPGILTKWVWRRARKCVFWTSLLGDSHLWSGLESPELADTLSPVMAQRAPAAAMPEGVCQVS